jgi:hypothetical protein
MDTPDFRRIAHAAAPFLKKDSHHTLITFTGLGLAGVIWAWFNTEYSIELLSVGVFLLILGIARYFFERSRRPYLFVVRIKKKEAIPYARIAGTYDYFVDIEPIVNYSFALDGKFDTLPTEPEQRLKTSPDIFNALREESRVMILFSATKILVGVLDENYSFTSYL